MSKLEFFLASIWACTGIPGDADHACELVWEHVIEAKHRPSCERVVTDVMNAYQFAVDYPEYDFSIMCRIMRRDWSPDGDDVNI